MFRIPQSLACRIGTDRGTTTIDFVAMVPFVVALALGSWQAVVAGQAAWLSGGAAAAAARAQAVGGDPRAAAKEVLPAPLHRGLRVRVVDGEVTVHVSVTSVVGARRLGTFSARAHLRDQRS